MKTPTPAPQNDLPDNAIHPTSRAAWRRWLSQHFTRTTGVWVVTYKKSSGIADMTYNDAVEEALCFGWVDSKPRALDATRTMLRYEGSFDNFHAFPPGIKRGILEWIATARTAATAEARAEETARLAAQNVRANQWTPKNKR
jgi:uncharacterized protein YdeI (YjbR/CyaY-like superfamily)